MSIYSIIYHQFFKRHYFAITGPSRVLPDFLVIGAKRCGTTSLFSHLPEHPCIVESHHDNIGFFNDNFNLGVNWYRSFFPTKSYKKKIEKKHGKFLAFDVTTRYMENKRTAENIRKIKPEIKIIVMLRNPIDRAYSQFHVSVKDNDEQLSFDEAINEEMNRLKKEIKQYSDDKLREFPKEYRHYIRKSLYAIQLRPWFDIFPRDNILVLSTEMFKEDEEQIYKEIFRFLDIPEIQIMNKQHMQKGKYSPMNDKTRNKLREFFEEYNTELFELIGKKFDWSY